MNLDIHLGEGELADDVRAHADEWEVCYASLGSEQCMSLVAAKMPRLRIPPLGHVELLAWMQRRDTRRGSGVKPHAWAAVARVEFFVESVRENNEGTSHLCSLLRVETPGQAGRGLKSIDPRLRDIHVIRAAPNTQRKLLADGILPDAMINGWSRR